MIPLRRVGGIDRCRGCGLNLYDVAHNLQATHRFQLTTHNRMVMVLEDEVC